MRTVEMVMTHSPILVSESTPLWRACRAMSVHHVRHLPVVDGVGRLVGLVTDFDAQRESGLSIAPHESGSGASLGPVSSATRHAVVARRDELVVHALTRQLQRRDEALVAVDRDGHPIGVLTEHDALALAEVCVVPWATVGSVATRPVSLLREDTRVGDALYWMTGRRLRHAPLLVAGELGVVSHRDLASLPLDAHARLLGELAHVPAHVIAADAPLNEAIRRMSIAGIGCLPVVEGGAPTAILTRTDVIRALLKALLHASSVPVAAG